MRDLLKIFVLLGALTSCVAEKNGEQDRVFADVDTSFVITVGVESPECVGGVRSSFDDDVLTRITDLNLFVYHDGRLLRDCCRYYTDMSSLMMSLPYEKNGFNIYIVGNMGRVEAPECEGDMSLLSFVIESYDDLRVQGFPLAEKFIGYRKGEPAHFALKRLVGQYDIRMRTSAADAVYIVKDVRVLNCAKDVYPFGSDTKATVFTGAGPEGEAECGDYLTESDVEKLNAGETVPLYFLENLQGVLLPDNTDRRQKVPSSLELVEKGIADHCTYIEITADISTPAAKYTDGKYRFYLGQDQYTDFSIKRNTLYDVTLDFTQNMVSEEDWRIEVGYPEVVDVLFSKREAVVGPYANDTIYVYSNTCNITEVMSLYGSGMPDNYYNKITFAKQFVTTYKGREAIGFAIESLKPFAGCYPYGEMPVPEVKTGYIRSRETYNGNPLIDTEIKIKHYDKAFPVLFKLERKPGSNAYSLAVRGYNPFRWDIYVSSTYVYDGVTGTTGNYWTSGLSESAAYMGTLDDRASYTNLSRIDITFRKGKQQVFMGDGCAATYGPGPDMYPEKFADMPDDGECRFLYYDKSISTWFPLQNDVMEYDGFLPVRIMGSSEVYFRNTYPKAVESTDLGDGINSRDCNKVVPFYFVNGCLQCYRTELSANALVKYPDERWRGSYVYFYGPGRDLFPANRDGQLFDGKHKMAYWITTWKNLLNNVKSRQESQYYSGKLYMTINGASSWMGANATENGYFTDGY